ncbi:hypothetical protein [Methanosarcina sp.]|uniref:hypothetical protein n=1 Tax=Methanosarcina sp. TaxID=2213 RepID=UPI003C7711F8
MGAALTRVAATKSLQDFQLQEVIMSAHPLTNARMKPQGRRNRIKEEHHDH